MRVARIVTLGVLVWLGVASSGFGNQDPIERVKSLYLAAEYEGALALLDMLPEDSGGIAAATYRMQCLIALERTREAQAAIESIVRADPMYRPSEAEVSPRILAVFTAARRALLPAVMQSMFAGAKAAFERESPDALARFDGLLKLLGDPDAAGLPMSADLQMIAAGFRDLAVARSSAPVSSPAAGPVPVKSAAVEKELPAVAPPAGAPAITPPPAQISFDGDPGVIPPVAVNQVLPKWQPTQGDAGRGYEGIVEVVIDARGAVESARLQVPIYPQFDASLLRAVRNWTYKPATKDGAPIRYLKLIRIQLQPVVPDRR